VVVQGHGAVPYRMKKSRLEAFSGGVIAILITIMVLIPDRRIEIHLKERKE
jgi:uncharacterized membrane protein